MDAINNIGAIDVWIDDFTPCLKDNLTGEVVNTYTTRNELMEKTGIKKSHLAQCIKTAKDNVSDRALWKKWVGEDGKKYGFVESLS